MVDISKYEKAQGALLASAIGDALGWPNENNSGNQSGIHNKDNRFVAWKRKNRYPFWHVETIEKGNYSDDTQLMLAVSRCLLCEDWMDKFTRIEYPFWLEYERGGGRAVKKAASLWKKRVVPWKCNEYCKDYFMAGGNGGAMRILPHVISNSSNDTEDMLNDVIVDVLFSHGHPRAILGATCYAYALDYLFNKQGVLAFAELVDVIIDGRKIWGAAPNQYKFFDWLETAQKQAGYNYSLEWNNCYKDMLKKLEYIKRILGDGLLLEDERILGDIGAYSRVSGAGDVAALSSIYFFSRYANTPELAISIPAFSNGIDTDTIAAMTGGLIGAFYGKEWIPLEWKDVQDYSYICSIAGELCEGMEKNELITGDIKQMSVVDSVEIKSKYTIVTRTKYQTSFGQTIYIKTMHERDEEKSISKESEQDNFVTISVSQIEKMIKDEELSRITLRKALDIVRLKHQGLDKEKIAKTVKVNNKIVSKIVDAFEQE